MKLSDIKPNPDNPRSITDDARAELGESMGEFGDLSGFVFNHDGTIISGHQRWEEIKGEVREFAIRETYETPLPEGTIQRGHFELTDGRKYDYAVRKWSVEKANAAMIRANKENAGTWDVSKLPRLNFNQEEAVRFGVPEIVFQVDNALNSEKLEAQEDDYEIPDEIKTDIVLGDLFEVGRHRLLCGDSTDSDAVARLMGGEKADLLLTDPPYGIGVDGQKESKAKNPKHNRKHHEFRGWDSQRPDKSTFDLILTFADTAIIWGGNYFADMLPAKRGWIYWSKGQDGLTMSDGELAWTSEDKPLRSVTVNRAVLQGSAHPTQKPIQVMAFCLKWAEKSNIILDTFLGSGTTMVAAHQLNRRCFGMEIDPKYCEVIVQRMLKLDPTLEIKRNGQPYIKNGD